MKYILTKQQYQNEMCKWKNNGLRTLFESVILPEVTKTLKAWNQVYTKDNSVLIGGLALVYYIKPRPTFDVDLIFLSEEEVPNDLLITGFKLARPHAFRSIDTHVEVEILAPETINQTKELFKEVFRTSKVVDGVRVASALSIIALKLGRYKGHDIADIEDLIQHCKKEKTDLNDINKYNLSDIELERFWKSVKGESINEKNGYPDNSYMLETNYYIKSRSETIVEINNASNNKDFPYDIYVMNDEFEPRFNFGNDFYRKRGITTGFFQFEISMYDIEKIEILGSSTDYKTFFGFENEAADLKKWLENEDNRNLILQHENKNYDYSEG